MIGTGISCTKFTMQRPLDNDKSKRSLFSEILIGYNVIYNNIYFNLQWNKMSKKLKCGHFCPLIIHQILDHYSFTKFSHRMIPAKLISWDIVSHNMQNMSQCYFFNSWQHCWLHKRKIFPSHQRFLFPIVRWVAYFRAGCVLGLWLRLITVGDRWRWWGGGCDGDGGIR